MPSKVHRQQLKEIYNHIVGFWYAEKRQQVLIFSLVEDFAQPAFLKVIEYGHKETMTVYNISMDILNQFYFELGYFETRPSYTIHSITPKEMIISNEEGETMRYSRRIDTSFADEIIRRIC